MKILIKNSFILNALKYEERSSFSTLYIEK